MPTYTYGGKTIRSAEPLTPEELDEVFAAVNAEERTPPVDVEERTPPKPEGFLDILKQGAESLLEPRTYLREFQNSAKVLPGLGAFLAGPVGAGVGEAARQSIQGEEPSPWGVALEFGGAKLGDLAGRGVGEAIRR